MISLQPASNESNASSRDDHDANSCDANNCDDREAGQGHVLTAIALPVALAFFTLLIVNLAGMAGDMLVIRGGLTLAVQDGTSMLRAEDTSGLYGLADTTAVRQVVDTVARENLDAQGYDPSLLDGALSSSCEAGSDPCIYAEPATGCGQLDPLTGQTRCGPFVSLRVEIPVRMPLGGHVSRTFHVASGARVTRTGEEPSAPASAPATPTPVEGGVGW